MVTYDNFKFWLNYRKSYLEAQLAGKTICYSSADAVSKQLTDVQSALENIDNLKDIDRESMFQRLKNFDMDAREPVGVAMLDALKERLDYIYQDKRINDKAELLQKIMRSTDYSHYSYMKQDLERFGYVRPFVRDLRGWLLMNNMTSSYYVNKRLFYADLPSEEQDSRVTWACRNRAEEAIYRAAAMYRQGYDDELYIERWD